MDSKDARDIVLALVIGVLAAVALAFVIATFDHPLRDWATHPTEVKAGHIRGE